VERALGRERNAVSRWQALCIEQCAACRAPYRLWSCVLCRGPVISGTCPACACHVRYPWGAFTWQRIGLGATCHYCRGVACTLRGGEEFVSERSRVGIFRFTTAFEDAVRFSALGFRRVRDAWVRVVACRGRDPDMVLTAWRQRVAALEDLARATPPPVSPG